MTTVPNDTNPTARVTRLLSATPEELFDAWTDPEIASQWMCDPTASVAEVVLDATVGGTMRLVMLVDGKKWAHDGIYREVKRPSRLVFTWASPSTHGRDSLVTVEMRPVGDKTELSITHELLPDEGSANDHREGWTRLVDHLEIRLKPRA